MGLLLIEVSGVPVSWYLGQLFSKADSLDWKTITVLKNK